MSTAKNDLGKLVDAARHKPVAIQRNGRSVAYVISRKEMERIEDWYLGARAMEVIKNGKSLGVEETRKFFDKILHADR